MLNRLSTYLYQRPKLILALLLGPPMVYMLVVYLGSLLALLINSFFYLEEFTGLVVRQFTLRTYLQLLSPTNLGIFGRTAGMAMAVTIADAVIAFPLAYYIARFASSRAEDISIYCGYYSIMVELSRACVCLEVDPCQGRHSFLGRSAYLVFNPSLIGYCPSQSLVDLRSPFLRSGCSSHFVISGFPI